MVVKKLIFYFRFDSCGVQAACGRGIVAANANKACVQYVTHTHTHNHPFLSKWCYFLFHLFQGLQTDRYREGTISHTWGCVRGKM
jgi:hypothetical protein